jgi:hypothetical protein
MVFIRLNVVKYSYRLSEYREIKKNLSEQINGVRLEISRFLTPSKIESLASDRFHLSKPEPKQVIYLQKDHE